MVNTDVETSVGAFGVFRRVTIVCSLLVLGVSCNLCDLEDKLLLIYCKILRYSTLNAYPVANDLQITRLGGNIICQGWAEAGLFARSCGARREAAASLDGNFDLRVRDVLADEIAVGGSHEDGRTVFVLFIIFGSLFWFP